MRRFVWHVVQVADPDHQQTYTLSRRFDWFILGLIAINVVALVAESVAAIGASLYPLFRLLDLVTVVVFSLEYVARLWSCTVSGRYQHPVWGRVRFGARPLLIIDLLAVLPFYLPFLGVDLVVLRSLRLFQVFRIAKVSRYLPAVHLMGRVFRKRQQELVVTGAITGLLLLISASLMYFAEREAQPEAFSSIPATMWYSIATLTTVGYGDIYPISSLGKLMGAVTAVLGIGFFALPTGIVGAGFVAEIEESRNPLRDADPHARCPNCGCTLADFSHDS